MITKLLKPWQPSLLYTIYDIIKMITSRHRLMANTKYGIIHNTVSKCNVTVTAKHQSINYRTKHHTWSWTLFKHKYHWLGRVQRLEMLELKFQMPLQATLSYHWRQYKARNKARHTRLKMTSTWLITAVMLTINVLDNSVTVDNAASTCSANNMGL